MSRYIDADELKRSYAPLEGCLDVRTLDGAKNIFDAFVDLMPAADVQEVKHGRWIEQEADMDTIYECSVCGEPFVTLEGTPADNLWNYCPNCGAKMDEVEE